MHSKLVIRPAKMNFAMSGTFGHVYAHRDDGKRFIVRADEKLTAFLELELAIRLAKPLRS